MTANTIAMSKARALGDSLLLGSAYIDLARIMEMTSEYDSALLLLNTAEKFVKPFGNTTQWEDILRSRGEVYDRSGIYDKALRITSYNVCYTKLLRNRQSLVRRYLRFEFGWL